MPAARARREARLLAMADVGQNRDDFDKAMQLLVRKLAPQVAPALGMRSHSKVRRD